MIWFWMSLTLVNTVTGNELAAAFSAICMFGCLVGDVITTLTRWEEESNKSIKE